MMRYKSLRVPLFLLAAFLLVLLSLSEKVTNKMRAFSAMSLSPLCSLGEAFLFQSSKKGLLELNQLKLENARLRAEIQAISEWALSQKKLEKEITFLEENPSLKKEEIFLNRLRQSYKALPARVIYRDPTSWSSSLWIDLGEKDNPIGQEKRIEKNSPVIVSGSLVGVIDFVGEKKSRVRLITDSALTPAVRALRGDLQNQQLFFQLEFLKEVLDSNEKVFFSESEKNQFLSALNEITSRMKRNQGTLFLAKGEVHGSSSSLWRSQRPLLKGIGFNLDFVDEKGQTALNQSLSILEKGDLLVTSGLDGVFPEGFLVGTVTQKKAMNECEHTYEIEAVPSVSYLNDLRVVFILPALKEI